MYPNQLGGYVINVNNSGHQETMPYLDKETFYFRAYDLLGQPAFKRVLVLERRSIIGGATVTDLPIRRMNYPTPDPSTERGMLLAFLPYLLILSSFLGGACSWRCRCCCTGTP